MKKLLAFPVLFLSVIATATNVETIHVYKKSFANNDRTAKAKAIELRDKAVELLIADCESDKGSVDVELYRARTITLNRARVMAYAEADVICIK